MPLTPIPDSLIHKPVEIEENSRLFDAFASLVEVTYSLAELDHKELQATIASDLLEKIRQKVSKDGEVKLPFGLVVKHNQESAL